MIYLILMFYLGVRVWPYIYSTVPLGYDPGLYLYLFKQYGMVGLFDYTKLPAWLVEVYPPLLPFVVRIVNSVVSPEHILIPLVLLAASALYWATYKVSSEIYGKKTALVTLAILTLSIIQYKFYWWYYVKNIFAVALTLLLIVTMNRKSKLAWLFAPMIILLHQPTAIVAMIVLALRRHDKHSLVTMGTSALAFVLYYIPNFQATIAPYMPGFLGSLTPAHYGAESGTFYSLKDSLVYMALYLPLAIATLFNKKIVKDKGIVVMMIVSLACAGGVFLSRRFVPIWDIAIIILSGATLARFNKKIIASYLVVLSIFFLWKLPAQAKPLIGEDEYSEIKLLNTTEPEAYILVADNEYTPWVYGYSQRRTIAPGFGENDAYWNAREWEEFWSSNDRVLELELLDKLPKPLYIYLGDKQRMILFRPEGECFRRFSWHVYQFVCGQSENIPK